MEILNDYTDDNNYTHIDCYPTNEEQGRTIAIVCRDTKKVFYIDSIFRINKAVTEAINEVLEGISKELAIKEMENREA